MKKRLVIDTEKIENAKRQGTFIRGIIPPEFMKEEVLEDQAQVEQDKIEVSRQILNEWRQKQQDRD